jgi:uncharacterized protein YndB with AHSA1/START domain
VLYHSATVTVSIDCPAKEVYEFLAEPLNLPTWSVAISKIEHRRGNEWVAYTADGEITFLYTPRNEYGILDYSMRRQGEEDPGIVPARVFANGDGAEITLTYFQRSGISDEAFASEVEWTRTDLLTVKALLEVRGKR